MSEDKSNGRYLDGGEPGFAALVAEESDGNGLVWRVVGDVCRTLQELNVCILGARGTSRVVTGPRDVLAYRVFPHVVLEAALGDGSFREIEV